jgi:hypothetical protein
MTAVTVNNSTCRHGADRTSKSPMVLGRESNGPVMALASPRF